MLLLINNTEQIQPADRNDTIIVLYGRNPREPEIRYEIRALNFSPYFYAPGDEVSENEDFLLEQECIRRIEYPEAEAFLKDTTLAKIYPRYPQDTREARELVPDAHAADVPFTNRFRIDTGIRDVVEVPDPPDGERVIRCDWHEVEPVEEPEGGFPGLTPRVCTLDIEVDDRNEGFPELGEERILSIVAHDSYNDEVVGFIDLDGRTIEECFPEGCPDGLDEVRCEPTERRMLIAFRSWFQEVDPDIVTGWNADDFDIPFIIERMSKLEGLNENALSPLGWAGHGHNVRIKGRTVYDLLKVYKANSFTELRSYSLDDVAQEVLGAEKIQFDGTFYDLYDEDPTKFLEYNERDVDLAVRINREADVIQFRDTLRREVGVDFEESYNANSFIEMLCRRKLFEDDVIPPTANYEGDEDYEGAHVFDAYEGVAENVVGIDLASLYPYTMAMLNASPETKLSEDDRLPAGTPVAEAENGARFRLDEDGLFKELIDDTLSLKATYKEKRQAADSDAEYEKWDKKYLTAKTIVNSLYGTAGWEFFFLYDKDVASAVTLTGQAVIKRTAEYVESQDYSVLYGDTDSTYITFDNGWSREKCLDAARELCHELNEVVYPELAEDMGVPAEDNLWDIEVEAYMERFFQAGKKKRYAYLTTWKDGRELDNPKISVTGFSSRRSDSAKLTKETEEQVLDAILHGNQDAVGTIVFEAAQEIISTEVDWDRIGIPGGLNNKIDPARAGEDGYYAFSEGGYPQDAHPRAVWNANKILDVEIETSDKPKRVYLEPRTFSRVQRKIDVIAFNEASDLANVEDKLRVDAARMTNVTLIRPLEEILHAVGVDPDAAVRGQQQTGFGAFE